MDLGGLVLWPCATGKTLELFDFPGRGLFLHLEQWTDSDANTDVCGLF